MRSWFSHIGRRGSVNERNRGGDWQGAAMERLEDRRLMSAGFVVQTGMDVGHVTKIAQHVKQRKGFGVITAMDLVATYTGRLVITQANGVILSGRLGVPTTVKAAALQITAQALNGEVLGTLVIDDLGSAGMVGPLGVSGVIAGKTVSLVITDSNGIGVGSLSGRLSRKGRLIEASFVSRIDAGIVVGKLQLARQEEIVRFNVHRHPNDP